MSDLPYIAILIACLTFVAIGIAISALQTLRKRKAGVMKDSLAMSADRWLQHLLPVLEGQNATTVLPVPASSEEMSVAQGVILELVQRVKGQYRDRLRAVLEHIGAEPGLLQDLKSALSEVKIKACRLLALTRENPDVDLHLSRALADSDWQVRLEAAYALALRQPLGLTLESVLSPLRTTPALESELAGKMVQQFALRPGRGEELARALMGSRNPHERVILLSGIAHADDLTLSDMVAWQLADYSPAVRAEAVRTLERMADPLQITKVTALANDPATEVRQAVAVYATSMGGGAAAQVALRSLAADSAPEVRQLAEAGLRRWQAKEHAPAA